MKDHILAVESAVNTRREHFMSVHEKIHFDYSRQTEFLERMKEQYELFFFSLFPLLTPFERLGFLFSKAAFWEVVWLEVPALGGKFIWLPQKDLIFLPAQGGDPGESLPRKEDLARISYELMLPVAFVHHLIFRGKLE